MLKVKTYEEVLELILNRMKEAFDTSEGTLAYILASATAERLAQFYLDLKDMEDNAYADTAVGTRLDSVVKLLGMERRGKTNAVVRLVGDMNFTVGDVFLGEEGKYEITHKDNEGYMAVCKTAGVAPNGYLGDVLPENAVDGFEGMRITSVVVPGQEEEEDEDLRERYYERLRCPICTGNLAYYQDVIHSLSGVGAVKVIPVNEESEVVRVIITDPDYLPAGEDLIAYIKNELDPEDKSGLGYGLAPIGHKVKVESAETVDIDIVVEAFPESKQKYIDRYARSALKVIFRDMNKNWGKSGRMVLWDRVIEDYYLSMGAEDVNVVSINGQPNRIVLEENQILGGVTINAS